MNNICSNCHRAIESNTSVDENDKQPTPGAISICFYCAQVCVFNDDLSLRKITDDEIDDLRMNEPLIYSVIHEAVEAIKRKIVLN